MARGDRLKKGLHAKSLGKSEKFKYVMREGAAGKLHSGKGGPITHNPAQIAAIAYSEAAKHRRKK